VRWHGGKPGTARVFYHVLRARHIERSPATYAGVGVPTIDGVWCSKDGAPHCALWMTELIRTRETTYVDKPGPGVWSYRIEVAGNWRDDPQGGDPVTYSPAAIAR
jgi:ribosomal protein L15E